MGVKYAGKKRLVPLEWPVCAVVDSPCMLRWMAACKMASCNWSSSSATSSARWTPVSTVLVLVPTQNEPVSVTSDSSCGLTVWTAAITMRRSLASHPGSSPDITKMEYPERYHTDQVSWNISQRLSILEDITKIEYPG